METYYFTTRFGISVRFGTIGAAGHLGHTAFVEFSHAGEHFVVFHKALILVVEDEPLIRLNAVSMIEEAGYDVIEAANADEAIRILETRADIRVVFTDIDMPGSIDGLKLARAVRDRWPPIRIIVASGKQTPGPGDLPADGKFLRKPYCARDVTSALQQVMATL